MRTPVFLIPRNSLGRQRQCDHRLGPGHYSERYTGTADYGGVHTNSGIGNSRIRQQRGWQNRSLNTAFGGRGGALYLHSSSPRLEHTVLAANRAQDRCVYWTDLYSYPRAQPELVGCGVGHRAGRYMCAAGRTPVAWPRPRS